MNINDAINATRILKLFFASLYINSTVAELNNKDKNLVEKGEIPNNLIQKWSKIKCKGGLFSFLNRLNMSVKSCWA